MAGTPHADVLTGSSRAEELLGFDGNDDISGGAGPDALSGAHGVDRIDARDGEPDTVNCGGQLLDRVSANAAAEGSSLGCAEVLLTQALH